MTYEEEKVRVVNWLGLKHNTDIKIRGRWITFYKFNPKEEPNYWVEILSKVIENDLQWTILSKLGITNINEYTLFEIIKELLDNPLPWWEALNRTLDEMENKSASFGGEFESLAHDADKEEMRHILPKNWGKIKQEGE